jgi:hypothetical protein
MQWKKIYALIVAIMSGELSNPTSAVTQLTQTKL